jgi:3'-phosphoadenosine 5'-phosphosulfate sulfotransferase (PAPS reductase)/FAD synthetase
MIDRNTNAQLTTEALPFAKPLLQAGVVISWWSGGITSAVACRLALEKYDNVKLVYIETGSHHEDTLRFKKDCEKWYGKEIETITGLGDKYNTIQDVWIKHKSLNVANGAIFSSELTKQVRIKWQKNPCYWSKSN